MYTIYAIIFSNRNIYIGMTNDLDRRVKEHKRGKTKTTKNRSIKRILTIEKCKDRLYAREREKYWKSGCGKEFLKIRLWGRSSAGYLPAGRQGASACHASCSLCTRYMQ